MGLLADLQKAFALALFPSQFVAWIDAVSERLDSNLAGTSPVALVTIHFALGAPVVFQVATVIPGVTSTTFTLGHPGAGIVTVDWPANTFPAATADPVACTTGTNAAGSDAQVEKTATGCKVRTALNPAATLGDTPFVLFIYGQ